jgi:cytochrome c-type biogenesis protein CcmH/NrfF
MIRPIAATLSLALLVLPLAYAAGSEASAARILRLENAVLAPCCYQQPVSVHQSEIALKMRLEIAKWVDAGRTDDQILGEYVERYGDKVLIDPASAPRPWSLFFPWSMMVLALIGISTLIWKWRARARLAMATQMSGALDVPDLPGFDDE